MTDITVTRISGNADNSRWKYGKIHPMTETVSRSCVWLTARKQAYATNGDLKRLSV